MEQDTYLGSLRNELGLSSIKDAAATKRGEATLKQLRARRLGMNVPEPTTGPEDDDLDF